MEVIQGHKVELEEVRGQVDGACSAGHCTELVDDESLNSNSKHDLFY